jgi:hypothetical protein
MAIYGYNNVCSREELCLRIFGARKRTLREMRVFRFVRFFYGILIAVLPSSAQSPNQSAQPPALSQVSTAASDREVLQKEQLRIQREMSQIAQEMEAVDSRMTQAVAKDPLSGSSKVISEVHRLLTDQSPGTTIKLFLDSPRNDVKWESCLKAVKLYTGLLEKMFEMSTERIPQDPKPVSPSSAGDALSEVARLAFLARMTADLELRQVDLQSSLMATPDLRQQRLWHQLREALKNDDRTYLERLKDLLAKSGVSLQQFAVRVISDTQKTNQNSASSVVEGLWIVGLGEDGWRLAEIPGVNPDFIQALKCDTKAMKDFIATPSNAALVRACDCKRSADGSQILAFTAKPADQAKSIDPGRNAPLTLDGLPLDSGTIRLTKKDLAQDSSNSDSGSTTGEAKPHQSDNENATFGVTNLAVPRPKIPSWWIRCACPEDHPDAGLVVDGVRWHAPVLQCPNPELRLRELLK